MTDEKSKVALDLDELTRASIPVRLHGEIIQVDPPSLHDLIKLLKIGVELQSIDESTITEAEVLEKFNGLLKVFEDIIPGLKDKKLHMGQLEALISLLVETSMPEHAEELEKRGITTEAQKKTKSIS